MTWCIHNACKIRDKAQRPSAFKSQPSGRLTCSTPELGAQFQPHRETKKERYHTWKHVLLPDHVKWLRTVVSLLSSTKGGCCRSFKTMHWAKSNGENGEARKSGQLFNTSTSTNEKRKRVRPAQRPAVQHNDIDGWDKEKRPAVHFT